MPNVPRETALPIATSLTLSITSGGRFLVEVLLLVFLMIYLGVVLPAVWSRRPLRRQAALSVLRETLRAIRRGNRR